MRYFIKETIKKIVPESMILRYHRFLSWCAAYFYGNPSREMLVIGVTGTNGKSTTSNLIAHVLDARGYGVGLATTVEFWIGKKRWLNTTKMTMLGRFQLKKLLRDMVSAEVKYAVIEVSSQGIMQHRIDHINFDIAVFTNLTPEHIEAHGGFENYKQEKGKLFAATVAATKKYSVTEGSREVVYIKDDYENRKPSERIAKTIVVNRDDPHSDYFASFPAQEMYCYGVAGNEASNHTQCDHRKIIATDVQLIENGSTFRVGGSAFTLHLPGLYNVYNALAAITVGLSRGMGFRTIAEVLAGISGVPGRFEMIDEGQPFQVIIDYAPEPASMTQLYTVIDAMKRNKIIHVLGSCGGGRDKARRPILGALAATHADYVVVTNEDPYDDNPMEIIRDVAEGAIAKGKKENESLFLVGDRKQAIEKALELAGVGDVVLITGKGAEQAMCVAGGKKIPWDDRLVARDALRSLHKRVYEAV